MTRGRRGHAWSTAGTSISTCSRQAAGRAATDVPDDYVVVADRRPASQLDGGRGARARDPSVCRVTRRIRSACRSPRRATPAPPRRSGRGRRAGLPRRRLPRRPRRWSAAYEAAAASREPPATSWCGPVTYLPPAPADGYDLDALATLDATRTRRRPAPAPGEVGAADGDHDLFWSLSFALSAPRRGGGIGGFDEAYVGLRRRGHRLRAARRGRRASSWPGSARRAPTTSTTRSERRRSSTSTTSCATRRCSTPAGDGGRWRAGWTRSRAPGSSRTVRSRMSTKRSDARPIRHRTRTESLV